MITNQRFVKILEKALDGERISEEEGLELLNAGEDELFLIARVANELRRRKVGEEVTYVVNRNINYTNICTGSCRFCAFRKNSKKGYFLSEEEIKKKVKEAVEHGATEVCIQGGLHPGVNIEFLGNLIKIVKSMAEIHVHAFSPMEIYHASKNSGMSIKEALSYLKSCGLDSIPGTSAEILCDEIREKICPEKIKTATWVEIIKTAHRLGIPSTATIMYGHIEKNSHVIEHLSIIRRIQDETQGFTEFIPLSFIPYNTELGKLAKGASSLYDAKIFAVSRIFLDNFANLQASWVKLGKKFAQLMLCYGANDLGGTLMEENISSSTGLNINILSKDELEDMIIQIGRIPRQRDTLYSHQRARNLLV